MCLINWFRRWLEGYVEMLILSGAFLIGLGAWKTWAAADQMAHRERMLRCGAALLCAGIAALAASLPMI